MFRQPSRTWEKLLVVAFVLGVFRWTSAPLASFDLWFYLRMGREIVTTQTIPHYTTFLSTADTFSAQYDINPEWGMSVLTYGVYQAFGVSGLRCLKGLLLTWLACMVYSTCRMVGLSPGLAVGWSWLGMAVMHTRFSLRAGLFTDLGLILLVIYLLRIETGRAPNRPAMMFWLFAIWSNFHQGMVSGLMLLGLYWVFGRNTRVRALPALAWAVLGSICRPGGYKVFVFVLEHMQRPIPMKIVVEWRPIEGNWWAGPLGWFCLIGLWAFWRAWRQRRFQLAHLVISLVFLALAFRYVRALGELAPVVTPLVAFAAGHLGRQRRTLQVLAAAAFMAWTWPGISNFSHLPTGGVAYLKAHPTSGRIFNTYAYGGIMAFNNLPPFVHGMTTLYPDSLLIDHNAIIHSPAKRQALMDKYNVTAILMRFPVGGEEEFGKFLRASPEWKLVYLDDTCLVFWRGEPPTPAYQYLAVAGEELTGPGNSSLEADLLRALEVSPEACKPKLLLAELAYHRGEVDRAIKLLETVARNPAFHPIATARLGDLYEAEKQWEKARLAFKESLTTAPNEPRTLFKLARVCLQLERYEEARTAAGKAVRIDPELEITRGLLKGLGGMTPRTVPRRP
ncbi:MAG: tetratricopeptide repeat protein [Candidatus Eremiobacteraeota bacterium]|nr:tetratricopeptide repeat protein [Candidatus Eremiobacteraeota bacterium]